MYIYIQQKINKIMICLLLFAIVFLIGAYLLFIKDIINIVFFVLLFAFIIFMFNYIIRFMEQNLEHYTIYKMLKKKQIALATIQNMEFYKELRDSTFTKQYIYKLHIQIKTLESKVIENTGMGFSSALTLVFITLKLTNYINWPWIWVFSPLWIGIGLIILFFMVILIIGRIKKGKWW